MHKTSQRGCRPALTCWLSMSLVCRTGRAGRQGHALLPACMASAKHGPQAFLADVMIQYLPRRRRCCARRRWPRGARARLRQALLTTALRSGSPSCSRRAARRQPCGSPGARQQPCVKQSCGPARCWGVPGSFSAPPLLAWFPVSAERALQASPSPAGSAWGWHQAGVQTRRCAC